MLHKTVREMVKIKLMVVGDGGVGKTCLLKAFSGEKFPGKYSSVSGDYSMLLKIQNTNTNTEENLTLDLFDSKGHEELDRLRPLSYPNTDIFLICFSVAGPSSLKRVKEYWFPEIKHHCPNTPFILVGTKVDLRGDRATVDELAKKQEEAVSKEEGERMAESVKAAKYLECSALTGEGVKNVFDEAILQILQHLEEVQERKKSKKNKCNVL